VPGYAYRLCFESFGASAEVGSDEQELLDAATQALPPDWIASSDEPLVRFGINAAGVITLDGAKCVYGDVGYSEPIVRLASLIRHHLALCSPRHIFIHAGVVAVDGVAIVIPGRSRTGKTTLVAALMDLGATYYSDEYAVVDEAGVIHPYAKTLSVRVPGAEHLGNPVPVPAGRTATAPIRAGLIVATKYREGERWQPTRISAAEGAQTLLTNTPAARSRPAAALAAVSKLARDAEAFSGPRGDAADTARALIEAVRSLNTTAVTNG
jgi:hypothetical protein